MKHPVNITVLLVVLFAIAQVVGLGLLYLNQDVTVQDGIQEVEYGTTAVGDRPEISGSSSFLFLIIGVLIGTMLVLALIRFRAFKLWKAWFLLAVWLAMTVAFGVLVPAVVALVLAGFLALWKVFRPNAIVHNLTEVFIYAGIVVLIAPLFDLFWAVLLLVAISVYDMYAVWKSKHMVTLAKAQTDSNLFAGLYVPKKPQQAVEPPPKPSKRKTKGAILGGGDIAFPLIFSGAVLTWLVGTRQVAPLAALWQTFIITACTTLALALLFAYSKKDRFYPAMPFLSAGCFVGLAIIAIL